MTLRLSLLVLLVSACAPEARDPCEHRREMSTLEPLGALVAVNQHVPHFGGGFRASYGLKWIAFLTEPTPENVQALSTAWNKQPSSLIVWRSDYTYLDLVAIHEAVLREGISLLNTQIVNVGIDVTVNRYVITLQEKSECGEGGDAAIVTDWLEAKGIGREAILIEYGTGYEVVLDVF